MMEDKSYVSYVTLAPSPQLLRIAKLLSACIYQYSVSLTHSLPLPPAKQLQSLPPLLLAFSSLHHTRNSNVRPDSTACRYSAAMN
jgi:hypothetical protein